MKPDKERIRQRFARAALTYDRQSLIQQRVADRLLTMLGTDPGLPPRRILEIGCCTGILTARLAEQYTGLDTLFINDLEPGFENIVREKLGQCDNIVFLPGDVETIAIPPDLDLIISSSTFHWLRDLPLLLHRLYQQMTPEGTLCFSLYSTQNLREVREITGIGLDYYSMQELQDLVRHEFHLLACEEELITLNFEDPATLVQHLRDTGVNALQTGPWSKGRLRQFLDQYGRRFHNSSGGVPLTYHPVYCLARRE